MLQDGYKKILKKGLTKSNIEIISNPKEGIKRAWSIIQSAKEEVLIMFSSSECCSSSDGDGGVTTTKECIRGS